MAPAEPLAAAAEGPSAGADLRRMANAIRALAMDAVEAAKSGHPGLPMGAADLATVLFARFLKFDAAAPAWPDRDRFVLSAGHGSMLLYALLYLTGYADMPLEAIKRFRQLGSPAAGHPEHGAAAGIETTTGPLGQGLANAVGMAIAERRLNARFGDALVDHRTYVLAGDGDLMEGVSHEAASLAGHLRLGRLTVFYDDNRVSIDGATDLALSDDAAARFAAYRWHVQAVDGHDPGAVAAAIAAAQADERPSLIACRTTIAYGAPTKAGTAAAHGAPLGAEEVAGARAALGWDAPPFEIPEDLLAAWRAAGARGRPAREAWERRLAGSEARAEFERALAGRLPEGWDAALAAHARKLAADRPKMATRQASGDALAVLQPAVPELLGGSADLTGSNNTQVAGVPVMRAGAYDAGYIHYGVREHAMAAAMNGMAVHGGVIPFGGTFLVFSDYARPALRLAAMMGCRVIHVMTHDSIGLGEDGPTHQPVEHLAALRAIPNMRVLRPADAVETAECWRLALARADGPTVLALTRQGVATLRGEAGADNLCAGGGYVLAEADGAARAVIVATGSEVEIALAARARLAESGVPVRVVSMPCRELFLARPEAERAAVLPAGLKRVVVEAGCIQGWEGILGPDGVFVGMHGFGASAPAAELYTHFGITAERVAEAVSALVAG